MVVVVVLSAVTPLATVLVLAVEALVLVLAAVVAVLVLAAEVVVAVLVVFPGAVAAKGGLAGFVQQDSCVTELK